jgi:hypothetical protein
MSELGQNEPFSPRADHLRFIPISRHFQTPQLDKSEKCR